MGQDEGRMKALAARLAEIAITRPRAGGGRPLLGMGVRRLVTGR